jgi:cytochrome c oxidase subunit III
VLALAATERNDRKWERIWLGATIVLGLTFLGGQIYEFNHMFNERFVTYQITRADGEVERRGVLEHEEQEELAHWQEEFPGATIARYPDEAGAVHRTTWTTSLFGSTFFTLTGFHGTHVAIGVIWLLVVLLMSLSGNITSKNSVTVEMAGLYWHFVDLVWVAIFTLIYLI